MYTYMDILLSTLNLYATNLYAKYLYLYTLKSGRLKRLESGKQTVCRKLVQFLSLDAERQKRKKAKGV